MHPSTRGKRRQCPTRFIFDAVCNVNPPFHFAIITAISRRRCCCTTGTCGCVGNIHRESNYNSVAKEAKKKNKVDMMMMMTMMNAATISTTLAATTTTSGACLAVDPSR
jgi:hypothetical protein